MSSDSKVIASTNGITRIFRSGTREVRALDDVSFSLYQGKTLALVGESGSGKTTAARILLGLDTPSAGSVEILGQTLGTLKNEEMRLLRREIQVVQQDPYLSLIHI